MIDTLLPDNVSPLMAAGLVSLSFFTSALSAALGLGGGVALLAFMVTFLPASTVIPVHGVVQLGSNAGRALLMRHHVMPKLLLWFGFGATLGAYAGGRVFFALPEALITSLLALFILYSVWAPSLRSMRIADVGYALVGFFTSFLAIFTGTTGPIVAAFWSPERMGRERLVATHAASMSIQHALKALVFGFMGFNFAPWLLLLGLMLASGFFGTMLGRDLLKRLDPELFAKLFRLVLSALALRLLWGGLSSF